MTGQTLLNYMELADNELELQSGEADVVKGLLALNIAQDYYESRAALVPNFFQSSTTSVSTSAATETTAYPAGLLRIDRLQLLVNSVPQWDIGKLGRTGGHIWNRTWPFNVLSTTTTGKPTRYWTNGTSFYWNPTPDATYSVRVYGLIAASDITANGTFAYPDIVAFPLASFAAAIIEEGLDDDGGLTSMAATVFDPLIQSQSNFNRDGARGLEYSEIHTE